MRIFQNLLFAAGLSTALALTGCESWHRSSNSDRSEGRALDDHHITTRVQTALKDEPVYKFNDVDVKTFNGVVQLSGFVNTDEQKQRAGEIAEHEQGVASVVNNITLKPQMPSAPTGRTDQYSTPANEPPPPPSPNSPPPLNTNTPPP